MQAFDLGCCCGETTPSPCILLSDGADRSDDDNLGANWDERNGDFDIESGTFRYKVAGGPDPLVISTVTHTSADVHVQATVFSSTNSTRFRLILGYVDDNNYFFVQFENHLTTGTLTLYEKAGGVETALDTANADIDRNTQILLTICHVDGFLKATVEPTGGSPHYEVYAGAAPTGGGFGFGLKGNPGGTIWFDNFQAEKVETGCASCQGPTTECEHCDDGQAPQFLLIHVEGATDDACSDCDEAFNGDFITNTASTCGWTYIFGADCHPTAVYSFGISLFSTGITVLLVRDDFGADPVLIYAWQLELTAPYDCMGFDGLDIPLVTVGGDCGGTPTLTLTAL